MELGDRYLVVQRASVGANPNRGGPPLSGANHSGLLPPPGTGANSGPLPSFAPPKSSGPLTTRAVVMLNMVTPEELANDEDYEDIFEDIKEECAKHGEVTELRIPRPGGRKQKGEEGKWMPGDVKAANAEEQAKKDEAAGVGRVYVLFGTVEAAQKGVEAIAGRVFGGRFVHLSLQLSPTPRSSRSLQAYSILIRLFFASTQVHHLCRNRRVRVLRQGRR
jgi:splicing factor U2AF subunit